MKLGVFSAERIDAILSITARADRLWGGSAPRPADIAVDWHFHFFTDDSMGYVTGGWWLINSVSSPFIALGHVAVVMLIYRQVRLGWLTRRFGQSADG